MKSSDRVINTLGLRLGQLTLVFVGLLLFWDAFPKFFPASAHDALGAIPLALIAISYLIYQIAQKPTAAELLKSVLLAAAFFLWAANQFWPNSPGATLLNDLAIAFFVLDIFLVIVGWPRNSANEMSDDSAQAESS